MHGVDGGHPETCRQHPVEGRGCPTSLDVTEDGDPGLVPGAGLDLVGEGVADAAETDVAEGVDLVAGHVERPFHRLGALGDHHDGRVPAHLVSLHQRGAHGVHVEAFLGNEGVRGPSGDARPHGNVSGVATHDLDHHDPMVGLGGGV